MLYQCFQQTRSPLESLTLDVSCFIPDVDLIRLLSWMPKLRYLTIHLDLRDSGVSDRFWRALRGEFSPDVDAHGDERVRLEEGAHSQRSSLVSAPICPLLEVLHVRAPTKNQLEVASTILARFSFASPSPTAARSASETCVGVLREIRLLACNFRCHQLWQYPGMQRRIQAGLDIYVTHHWPGQFRLARTP